MALEKRVFPVKLDGTNAGAVEPRALTDGLSIVENGICKRVETFSKRGGIVLSGFGGALGQQSNTTVAIAKRGSTAVSIEDGAVLARMSRLLSGDTTVTSNDIQLETGYFCHDVQVDPIEYLEPDNSVTRPYWCEMTKNSRFIVVSVTSSRSSALFSRIQTYNLDGTGPIQNSTLELVGPAPVRVVTTSNGNIAMFYVNGGAITYRVMNATTGVFGAAQTAALSGGIVAVNGYIATCPMNGDVVGVAFRSTVPQIAATFVDVIALTSSATTWTTATYATPLTLDIVRWQTGTNAVVVWANATGIAYAKIDQSSATVIGPTTTAVGNIVMVSADTRDVDNTPANGGLSLISIQRPANVKPRIGATIITEGGGALSFSSTTWSSRGGWPVSSPAYLKESADTVPVFAYQAGNWWNGAPTNLDALTVQRNYYVGCGNTLNGTGGTAFDSSVILPGYCGHNFYSNPAASYYPHTLPVYVTPKAYKNNEGSVTVALLRYIYPANASLVLATITKPRRCLCRQVGDRSYIASNNPIVFDGSGIRSNGLVEYPEGLTVSIAGAGGSWTAGTYSWCAVFETYDNGGAVHQSAPSPAISGTIVTTTNTATLTIPCPTYVSQNSGSVRAVIYRTVADGTRYYRLDSVAVSPFADSVTYADTGGQTLTQSTPDGVVPLVEVLYTEGGVLENIAPRPHRRFCIHQNRYIHVDRDNEETTLYVSREMNPRVGIPHNDTITIVVPAEGGAITSVESLETALIIFKKGRIYACSGNGPDDTGGGSQYSRPVLVSDGIGCRDEFSVTTCPAGLMFISLRGIYLLDRGMQLQPIGERVRTMTDHWVYDSAITNSKNGLCMFGSSELGSDTADAPRLLVYDYIHDKWFCWTGISSSGNALLYMAEVNDKVIFVTDAASDPTYYRRPGAGGRHYEPSVFWDYTSASKQFYSLGIRTNWLNPYQRDMLFRVYGAILHYYVPQGPEITAPNTYAQHDIKCTMRYDYDPRLRNNGTLQIQKSEIPTYDSLIGDWYSVYDPEEYTIPQTDNVTSANTNMVKFRGSRQRCKSVMINIYDDRVSDGAGGYYDTGEIEYSGLSIVCGVSKPSMKNQANSTYSSTPSTGSS